MKHFAGDIHRFSEIEYCICDVFSIGDRAHRRERLQKILGIIFVHRCIDNSRCHCIEADVILRVFTGKATRHCVQAALSDHSEGHRQSRVWIFDGGRRYVRHAATSALNQHLLHRQLRDVDEAFYVGGQQRAEIVSRVVDEGLRDEDACGVDDVIDRTES